MLLLRYPLGDRAVDAHRRDALRQMIVPRVERDFFAIDRDFHAGRADGGANVVAGLLHVEQLDGDFGAVAQLDLLGIPGVQVDDADERCFRRQGRLRPVRTRRGVSLPR